MILQIQISEHWLKKIPEHFLIKFSWLIHPDTAFILISKDGTVHEWITSDVVIGIDLSFYNLI